MNPACARVVWSLDAYLEDRLAPAESAAVRSHLASCDACRARAAEKDPLAHFAVLAEDRPPEGAMEGFLDSVLDGIAREEATVPSPRRVSAAWPFTPAALAASLLIMIAAADFVLRVPGDAIRVRGPVVAREEVTQEVPRAGATRPTPGTVAEVRTPDAREVQIYTMTWLNGDAAAGDAEEGQVAELVLIVDAGLDLR